MGCFVKRTANEFNFVTWNSGNNVLVADLPDKPLFCSSTLAAPSSFTATRMTFADVDLEWVSNTAGAENGFKVQVSTDNVTWATSVTVGSGVLTANVTIPSVGDTYYYRVIATGSIPSQPSNVSSFATVAAPITLDAITTVTASTIDLSWVDTEVLASSYSVERSLTGVGAWTEILSSTTLTSFQDTALDSGIEYFYRVRVDGAITSDYTSVESATTALEFSFNNSLKFNGVDNYVSYTSPITRNTGQSITLSSWVQMTPSLTSIYLAGSELTVDKGLVSVGASSVQIKLNGGILTSSIPLIGTNTWVHVMVVKKSDDKWSVYKNGVISTQTPFPVGSSQDLSFDNIGRFQQSIGSFVYSGSSRMAESAIWLDVEGTEADAIALYNSGSGAVASEVIPNPELNYRFTESGTDTIAVDSSGNGNDGTLIDFPEIGMWE